MKYLCLAYGDQAKMSKLTPAQSEYLGVPAQGPFKPDDYRY